MIQIIFMMIMMMMMMIVMMTTMIMIIISSCRSIKLMCVCSNVYNRNHSLARKCYMYLSLYEIHLDDEI